MKAPSSRAGYRSPLRERQKEQTRDLILETVAGILAKADLGAVSVAEVARVAGVTKRTVFRHFSTREELLKAFWTWQLQRSGGQHVIAPRNVEALLETIRRLFDSLDRDEGVIRAVLSAPEGREMRKATNQARFRIMDGFLAPLVPGLADRERADMAAGIVSVCSVLSWLFMRDNCGFDGKRAGEAASLAVALMIEGGQRRSARKLVEERKAGRPSRSADTVSPRNAG